MQHTHFRSLGALYRYTAGLLTDLYPIREARQIARHLVEGLTDKTFEKILIDEPLADDLRFQAEFKTHINQLLQGSPIQYVLGKAHFFGRDFKVNPSVLIPRQETESMIYEIKQDVKDRPLKILDIGTGSGCIAITLALELIDSDIYALDIDSAALAVAKENADVLGASIHTIRADILQTDKLPEKFDLIVSNPPYVTNQEKDVMHQNVLQFEPAKALFVPDNQPLLFYKKILMLAEDYLLDGGSLYFEINEQFGQELTSLVQQHQYRSVRLVKDLNGKDRVLKAQK